MSYRIEFKHKLEETWLEYIVDGQLSYILRMISMLRTRWRQYEWRVVGHDGQISKLIGAH